MVQAGAAGYVLKDDPFANLTRAIRAVATGVEDANGKPADPTTAHTGPAGRTVTSVSEWLLPVPGQGS